MQDTCEIVDDVEQLMFQNTALINLMQGYCIMAQDNIDEMEYLAQGFNILIANQKTLQTKMDFISNKIYKDAFSCL